MECPQKGVLRPTLHGRVKTKTCKKINRQSVETRGNYGSENCGNICFLAFWQHFAFVKVPILSARREPFFWRHWLKLSEILLLFHSLMRGVLIQSCPAGAKNFTNYVFCHPQFSGVIQNIENHCAILTPICLGQLLSK